MSNTTFAGILFVGFIFGYLLFYAVRNTKEFNITFLATAFGAVGGGPVIAFFGEIKNWVGPYGIGVGVGFFGYAILSLILTGLGKPKVVGERIELEKAWVERLSMLLLGFPRKQ